MGIYIPSLDMPKRCVECWLLVCACRGEHKDRPDWCPLVEVPAHGRLVDADAFSAEMKKRQDAAREWKKEAKDSETAARADAVLSFLCEVKLTLDKLPTVIPKEDET